MDIVLTTITGNSLANFYFVFVLNNDILTINPEKIVVKTVLS